MLVLSVCSLLQTAACAADLYDYRNGSTLREWMLNEHYFGPTAMGDPDVSGLFIDDAWNAKGLTEEGPGWMEEMELTAEDLRRMQSEYQTTINAVHKKAVAQGGYSAYSSPLLGRSEL